MDNMDLFGDAGSGVTVIDAPVPQLGYALSDQELTARRKPAAPQGRRERGLEAVWLTLPREQKRVFDDLVHKIRLQYEKRQGWKYTAGEVALKAMQAYAKELGVE